jgi:hypothetical protein
MGGFYIVAIAYTLDGEHKAWVDLVETTAGDRSGAFHAALEYLISRHGGEIEVLDYDLHDITGRYIGERPCKPEPRPCKTEPWTVEFYDSISGKWNKRTLKNKASADVYMDGIHKLLKQSGDEHPNVWMYETRSQTQ